MELCRNLHEFCKKNIFRTRELNIILSFDMKKNEKSNSIYSRPRNKY